MESSKPKQKKQTQPFRLLAVAPSGTGKTYSVTKHIADLITNKAFNARRFVVFSPTASSDPSMADLIKLCK